MSDATASKSHLSETEILNLIIQAQQGDLNAREKVFMEALPLADTYSKRYEGSGVPVEDLYQEACYGILVAIDHFDVQNTASFKTYCTHYIMKYLRLAFIQQNSNLPSSYDRDFYYEIKRYISAVEEYVAQNHRSPTDQELSEILRISLLRAQRLRFASAAFMAPSIDIDEISFALSSSDAMSPVEDQVIRRYSLIQGKLRLTNREREVLERRCGFNASGIPEKWAYISAAMGYTIPTLKTVYQTALTKLKRVVDIDSFL